MAEQAATPAWAAMQRRALLALAVTLVVLVPFMLQDLPRPGPATRETLAYLLAFVFGGLIGATELSGRYRDDPLDAALSPPGLAYIAVNGIAAAAMVWLLFSQRLVLGVSLFGPHHPLLDALVIGGFGAMALFRSSVFTVRVKDTSVAVGPAAVLQEILRATDRETDRRRARPRAEGVKRIMQGVVFQRAKTQLPAHCLALMQNVSAEEREALNHAITALETPGSSDESRSYSLGLLLMTLVGEEVLSQAVAGLGDRICGPVPDDPPVFGYAATLAPDNLPALLELCVALDPRGAAAAVERRRRELPAFVLADLITPPAEVAEPKPRLLLALARLRHVFGQDTLAEALKLLVGVLAKPSATLPELSDFAVPGAAQPQPPSGQTPPATPAAPAPSSPGSPP